MLKGLLYIVYGMNVFNQLNCFNRLNSLKSSEINRWYRKFNRLISLELNYISCDFKSRGTILSF